MDQIRNVFLDKQDFYWDLLIEHIQISMSAIIIAGILGLLIGILISEYNKTSKISLGVINFMYTIPSISMLGFLIPFSGIGNTTAVIALCIYALLPMVRNTYTGLHNVPSAIIEASKGMGSTRKQILYKIKLPLAMPVIMSGIRNMTVMTIALTGIASFIGAGGLGVAIYRGITTNNKAMTIIGSLMIALLALVIDFILGVIEKRIQHKDRKKTVKKRMAIIVSAAVIIVGLVVSMMQFSKKETIQIASKPMSEQYVLSEMLKTLIEADTEVAVELVQGVGGGTSNIHPGMMSQRFDLYPEYTGTGWNQVLKESSLYSEALFPKLQKKYQKLGLTWESMIGFNNTYAIAIRKDIADAYQLETFSDLQKVDEQLIFGASYDYFEREDGYQLLCDTYGLQFKSTMDLDIGLKYDAMRQKKIDVMEVFTTDGQLSIDDIKVLKDDRSLYPSYMCGIVVRNEVLKKYPEVKQALKKVSHAITDKEMATMNYLVENKKQEPKDVAEAFLRKKSLIQ